MTLDGIYENMMPIPESGCLIWMGASLPEGYGQVMFKGKSWRVTRLLWTLINGEIAPGMCVCHKCDVPACCNINHLFLGTNLDNIKDKVRKGRHKVPIGEAVNTAKLTKEQVLEIRKLLSAGVRAPEIAMKYGVKERNIYLIRIRKTWNSI